LEHNFEFQEVDFAISFGREIDTSKGTQAFTFTDLLLHGATLNFDRSYIFSIFDL
jgi:hypothetical protein